jgi:hypothetical protein
VFEQGRYTVKVGDPDRGKENVIKGLRISKDQDETIKIEL